MNAEPMQPISTGAWQALARDHLWMAYSQWDQIAAEGGPVVLVEGAGVRFWDTDGRTYLDGIAALEACAIGHGRVELAQVAYEQMRRMEFYDVFRYGSPPTIALAAKLAELAPGSLNRVHFTPGGSEAVETALKIARQYQRLVGSPERFKVISRHGAYHGCTYGAMSVDGRYWSTRTELYEPLPPIGRFVHDPHSVEELEALICSEQPETVAAVILDPAGTALGVRIPPPGYLAGVRELCNRYGIVLIVDEVLTGFGRTGQLFCCQHWNVVPDIMTVSKALSSGYMPIGAAIVRDEIAERFQGGPEATLSHGQTFGGHPVACAVALANIAIIEREQLVERAAENGAFFLAALRARMERRRICAEVRGLGLLIGLEMRCDRDTGLRFANPGLIGKALRLRCRDLGLLLLTLHPGDTLFLAPPLVATQAELEEMAEIVDQAVSDVEANLHRIEANQPLDVTSETYG